jgi:hypothetical protein
VALTLRCRPYIYTTQRRNASLLVSPWGTWSCKHVWSIHLHPKDLACLSRVMKCGTVIIPRGTLTSLVLLRLLRFPSHFPCVSRAT